MLICLCGPSNGPSTALGCGARPAWHRHTMSRTTRGPYVTLVLPAMHPRLPCPLSTTAPRLTAERFLFICSDAGFMCLFIAGARAENSALLGVTQPHHPWPPICQRPPPSLRFDEAVWQAHKWGLANSPPLSQCPLGFPFPKFTPGPCRFTDPQYFGRIQCVQKTPYPRAPVWWSLDPSFSVLGTDVFSR